MRDISLSQDKTLKAYRDHFRPKYGPGRKKKRKTKEFFQKKKKKKTLLVVEMGLRIIP